MFRKKILDKMNTPDSLDQLLVVVTPQSQLTLAALTGIFLVALIWGFIADIPVTVAGRGILLKPGSIRMVQAPSSGLITDIKILGGDQVKAGDVLARIEKNATSRTLEQQTARYVTTRDFNRKALEQAARKRDLELDLNKASIEGVARDLTTLRELKGRVGEQLVELNKLQAEELGRSRTLLRRLRTANRDQLANVNALVEEGVVSVTRRLSAEASVVDIESRLGELDVRLKQVQMNKVEAEQRDLKLRQEISGLETQERQLVLQHQRIEHEYELEVQRRTRELQEQANSIRLTRAKLFREEVVRSPFDARVLEVSANVGQMVPTGDNVAMLHVEAQGPFHRLELDHQTGRGTFRLAVGGEETAPLPVTASPEALVAALQALPTLKARRGSLEITGRLPREPVDIRFVPAPDAPDASEFLELTVIDSELFTTDELPAFAVVMPLADRIPEEELKHLGFFPIGSGLKVAPGMEIRVDPSNIERQRFGSILGEVTRVSPFPVTAEGVLNVVGSTDLAKTLVEAGGTILVEARLAKDPDAPSGYQWTSKGPPIQFAAGTTTKCRVTTETRKPITFVIPLLRKWLLGESDQAMTPEQLAAQAAGS
jgi:HlyD family secretion protein